MALVSVNLKELAKEWKWAAYIVAFSILLVCVGWFVSLVRCP